MEERRKRVNYCNYVMAEALPGPAHSPINFEPPRVPGTPGTYQMRMFRKIISSELTIKAQQRGEPDLTEEEKIVTLSALLRDKPATFLMRFGSILDNADLDYFSDSSGYEVEFRVKELRRQLVPANSHTRTRNRRYKCLEELMGTDYFSEEEMRQRNPLLFRHYIGQYLSEEEAAEMDSTTTDMSLSSHIMRKMRQDERREKERLQVEREREQEEEEDTSSEEEEEEEGGMDEGRIEVTEGEKILLKREFLRAMQLSFLRGEDKEFDYSSVDSNERYDNVEMQQQDGEDAYFDDEEPQWCREADTG